MKKLILAVLLMGLSFGAVAEDKKVTNGHFGCVNYFAALEFHDMIETGNVGLIQAYLKDNDKCFQMKDGLEYYHVKSYRDLGYIFVESRVISNGELVEMYLF